MTRTPLLARCAFAAALALACTHAHGDAPLRTDNADVPDQGNCKVEAGYEGSTGEPGGFVQASCVPFGVVELGAGYARTRTEDHLWGNGFALQAKVPLVAREDGGLFAMAGVVSVGRQAFASGGGPQFAWINVPASFYLHDDRWRVHLNAGVLLRRTEPDLVTWGVATEYDTGPVTWLAESYRVDSGNARYNLGARYEVREGFALYVSADRGFGHDPGSWVVVAGIRVESPDALKGIVGTSAAAGRALAAQGRTPPAP